MKHTATATSTPPRDVEVAAEVQLIGRNIVRRRGTRSGLLPINWAFFCPRRRAKLEKGERREVLPGSKAPYIKTIAELQARTQWWSQYSGYIHSSASFGFKMAVPTAVLQHLLPEPPLGRMLCLLLHRANAESLHQALFQHFHLFDAFMRLSIRGQFVCYLRGRVAHVNAFYTIVG